MKRDWDVIRKILIRVEALPTVDSTIDSSEIEGVDSETAAYHMRLLLEAGLTVGGCADHVGPPHCHAFRLTWAGHEFLDQIKRDTVWNKVKETARKKGMELSFEVIKAVAKNAIDAIIWNP